jgi:lysine 2,3-aminomutase
MAGTKTGEFKEIISPYLKKLICDIEKRHGINSKEALSIKKQYLYDKSEKIRSNSESLRHYYSEVDIEFNGEKIVGVERLYKKTVLIEPTTVCAAHCRWCLRGQYPVKTLRPDDTTNAIKYIGTLDEVNEILITGGDPLMSLSLLGFTISEIKNFATNIKIIRIGTRVPVQDPSRVNEKMLDIFKRYDSFRYEVGLNVCSHNEFTSEAIEAIKKLTDSGVRLYNQNPLLKDVNDDYDSLCKLLDLLREHNIEAHYLFHAIPMLGTNHHRTTLKKGLDLIERISSSGEFSGRAKPKYAVLSDIGKIVLYDGCILAEDKMTNKILLKSGYKYKDRLKWVPGWKLPSSASIDKYDIMSVWYQDANELG